MSYPSLSIGNFQGFVLARCVQRSSDMGHHSTAARRDDNVWEDPTVPREPGRWDDTVTASLDFGETYVDTGVPFGLLAMQGDDDEDPHSVVTRKNDLLPPSSARPPSMRHASMPPPPLRAKPARKLAPLPAPKASRKPAPPPPSSKRAPSSARASAPSIVTSLPKAPRMPSMPPPSAPASVEVVVSTEKAEFTQTARMASAPPPRSSYPSAPMHAAVATPLAFAAPPPSSFGRSSRPSFVEVREPLPSVSVEIESIPALFAPPRSSPLVPVRGALSLAPPALYTAPDASASVPAAVVGITDGLEPLELAEASLVFRAARAKAAYAWAAALVVLAVVAGAAFGSRGTASAAASTSAIAAPLAPTPQAPPRPEAPPAQPPIEQLVAPTPAPVVAVDKAKPVVAPLVAAAVTAAPKPSPAPAAKAPPTSAGPSRLAVLAPPPGFDKKGKKADKGADDSQSAAAAETLAHSKIAIGDSL